MILFKGSVRKAEETLRTSDNLVQEYENGVQYVVALPPPEEELTAFDIARYLWSTAAVIFSVVIIFSGIATQKYVLPTPPGVTFFIFFLSMTILFDLEGLMIAVVAVQYWDR
jgi:hypothetical protein